MALFSTRSRAASSTSSDALPRWLTWPSMMPRGGVGHLGLGHEHDELAFHGHELAIVEQRCRAEAGAVDEDRFGERGEIAGRVELAHHDAAAERDHFAHQRVEVDRRLDAENR